MARFAELARLAEELAGEAGRLKKRAAIAAALTRVVEEAGAALETVERAHAIADAGLFCLYLAGQSFAEADPRKLNAGGALLTRVLKQVSGCTDAALAAAYRRHGDLGAAAYDLLIAGEGGLRADQGMHPTHRAKGRAMNGPPSGGGGLTLDELADAFDAMAGARSTAARAAAVEGLLRGATALEAKYLLKLMLGDMRIGVKQSLIEEAIAVAAAADVAAVRNAVMLEADLARAAVMAFAGSLAEARMRLFHPLGFMLASPVETPEEAVERFTEKPAKVAKPRSRKVSKHTTNGEFADLPEPEAVLPVDAAEEDYALDVELAVAPDQSAPVQAFLEDKYDGMRAQLHCGDGQQPGRVAIYSRNREDITHSFPEIEEAFRGVVAAGAGGGTGPLILDGELLAWDFVANQALPFAVLGQRIGRKRVDAEMRRQVPVVFMAFDLLFQDGELLLTLPLRERRARLEAVIARLQPVTTAPMDKPVETMAQAGLFESFDQAISAAKPISEEDPGAAQPLQRLQQPFPLSRRPVQRLMLSPAVLVESADAIDQAYADARARANEGVMIKAAGSAYLPGRRGLAWVKLKRELATLDVVITGAEFGHGRRAGLLSDYTFAVRGPASGNSGGELLNVGKAYSGVTDAEIAELTEWLKAHTIEDFGHFRTVEPLRVLEVAFNNVMRSERHSSGFALRFPRILRVRDDKPVEEIDTLERVEEVYQAQPDKPRQ